MGKSMNRDERKSSKYTVRKEEKQFKDLQQYASFASEPKPERPKPKWRPRSEVDSD